MEMMGLCCAAPFLLAFLVFWTAQIRAKRISSREYWGVLGGIAAIGFLGGLLEIRYIVFVEGLGSAACDGNAARAEWLLSYGGDPNVPDDNGEFPLQCAVVNNHPEVVRVLLRHHADPNIRSDLESGQTLTRWAADHSSRQIRLMLEEAGGKP